MADKKIVCSRCRNERIVTNGMAWLIKTGKNTGRCKSCSLKENKYRLGTTHSDETRTRTSRQSSIE
jgi:hypothetical protein